ncbi:MAG: penicillin acylase family protein [Nocardioidaceae bacterium]|nr:penicillin acylase family protein [Nocardioidaceae bacterium]
MRRVGWVRILVWTGITLAVALVAVVLTSWWTVQRSMPQTEGTIRLAGLDGEVTVLRDGNGIPQVYADTSNDLFFGQGYVQAQDRFFEMDFRRHVTAGRLTELFGQSALKTDEFVRTLGWRRVAEQELALLAPDTRRYLDRFAAGVNAYLEDRDGAEISLEYAVLGLQGVETTPEPWEAADSLAWLKAIAWDLGSNMDDEITRSLLSTTLSTAEIDSLYPPYPYAENQPIVTQGAIVDGVFEQDATGNGSRLPERPAYLSAGREALLRAKTARRSLDGLLGRGDGLGSNAWAVSGEHTASGAPLLANDPHLAPTMPGVWYQTGLHCNEVSQECPFDVSGFSFAGLPGIVIGHNADIAWGFTNLYPDVQDLYLEKVTGDKVLYDGKRRPLTTRQETFSIAGTDELTTITVRESRHGPLISDVDDNLGDVGVNAPTEPSSPARDDGYAVALQWTALTPGRTADALFGINAATDWTEFRAAARNFEAPSQNLVYADTAGHIGYQAPGRIPVRRSGNGDWPVPGWDPAYDWAPNYVPYDALPSVLDPDDGYVVTANQAVTKKNYPFYLGSSFDYGYRSERIRGLLETRQDLTPGDMTAIQLDDFSALAERLTPMLRSIRLDDAYYQRGQEVLHRWDFRMNGNSSGAAYFNAVWDELLDLTFSDQLPADALPEGGSRWWAVMEDLVNDPDSAFWDDVNTPVVEGRNDILRRALMQGRDDVTELSSRNPVDWRWGMLHQLTLRNQSLGSADSPVAFLFNRGGYELGGGPSVPNATSWDATVGFEVSAVPSMRMVIPLDDLDAARWINLTGASGHAYNDHYTDQTDLWARGKTLPWVFTADAVNKSTEQRLTLAPAG